MPADRALHRSYLYAPGSSSKVMLQALATPADAIVLDLEDAVAPHVRSTARALVADALEWYVNSPDVLAGGPRPSVHVRINRRGAGFDVDDIEAVCRPGLRGLRLPKADSADAIRSVATALDELEPERGLPPGTIGLYPIIESAAGALAVRELLTASPRIRNAALGAADLLADIGASGDDDLATLYVRSHLVLVSRVAGVGPPIDSVHVDLDDVGGLRRSARRARALGFFGKSIIHPRQIEVVHEVFTPTPEELDRAQQIVDLLADLGRAGGGVGVWEGRFVDAAVATRAQAMLDLRREG